MTLTDFLLARIAEDETVARAIEADLRREFGHDVDLLHSPLSIEDFGDMGYPAIVVDLTRALAECEAKRRIVERQTCDDAPGCGDHDCIVIDEDRRILGTIYADHPDYDETWRP